MFTLTTLIVAVLAALLVGAALGTILTKSLNADQRHNRSLESRLREAEERLASYQQDVAEHFAETSKLVNSLTQSYKEVHQHLAGGALKLTNADISRQLVDEADGKLLADDSPTSDTGTSAHPLPQAPRDWAPRSPGTKGQLSEDFDLDPNSDPGKHTH